MTTAVDRNYQKMDPAWLLWWACVSTSINSGVSGLKVKFGVILPVEAVCRTMHPCTKLPIAMAEEWLIAEDLTPFNWVVDSRTSSRSSGQRRRTSSSAAISVQFEYRNSYSNSYYSDTFGPLHAMEIYYRGAGCRADDTLDSQNVESLEVQVFYGPCDKYALSPIAKYAGIWNVPVITPGGLTSRFNSDLEYMMLTRFIAPFEKVAKFVMSLLAKYGWWHLSFLFHNNIGPDEWKGHPMCYDIKEAVAALVEARAEKTANSTSDDGANWEDNCCVLHQELFNENYYDYSVIDALLDKIRKASRGKCVSMLAKCICLRSESESDRCITGPTIYPTVSMQD